MWEALGVPDQQVLLISGAQYFWAFCQRGRLHTIQPPSDKQSSLQLQWCLVWLSYTAATGDRTGAVVVTDMGMWTGMGRFGAMGIRRHGHVVLIGYNKK